MPFVTCQHSVNSSDSAEIRNGCICLHTHRIRLLSSNLLLDKHWTANLKKIASQVVCVEDDRNLIQSMTYMNPSLHESHIT